MASAVVNILKKTTSLAGATFASRLLGFLREILMAAVLGGGAVASAWAFAFKVPNLFRRVFGEGLIGTVLIPMMSHTIQRNGRESARKRFSTIFLWLSLILGVICIVVSSISLLCLRFVTQEHFVLALKLIPLLMPYCIFICLIGVMTSVLNSVKVFFLPAVLSLLLNVFMIACLLWVCPMFDGQPEKMLDSLALSVLLSGVLELFLMLVLLKRYGFLPGVSKELFLRTRALLELWHLALPGLAGALAYQFSVLSDAIIAGWISPFAVAALSYSERLIYLPIGVFAVAFGTVSLTEMSYMAQKKDYPQLIATQFSSMRYLLFLTVPLAAFLCVFHIPIIRLTFYRGLFDDRALAETAQALFFYSFGIPAFAAMKVTLAGFYSRKDMRTPMFVSIFCVLLNLVLNLILMHPLKQGGIALSTVISSYLNNLILLYLLQRRIGGIPIAATFRFLSVLMVVSLAGLWPAKQVFDYLLRWGAAKTWFGVFPPLCAGAGVYLAIFLILAILLRMDEMKLFFKHFSRKKGA